jgi:hypothetical protein
MSVQYKGMDLANSRILPDVDPTDVGTYTDAERNHRCVIKSLNHPIIRSLYPAGRVSQLNLRISAQIA